MGAFVGFVAHFEQHERKDPLKHCTAVVYRLGFCVSITFNNRKAKKQVENLFFFSFFFSVNLKTQTLVPPFLQITIIKSLEISLPKPVSITSLTQLISKYDPINMIIVDSNAKYV